VTLAANSPYFFCTVLRIWMSMDDSASSAIGSRLSLSAWSVASQHDGRYIRLDECIASLVP
jgi:hypothetical protein